MIISKNETLFNKYFIEKGILTVQDIINEYGKLLSWVEVQRKFSLNNSFVISWLGLLKCIPRLWEDKLINDSNNNINEENITIKHIHYITSRSAYLKLIEPLIKPPTSQKALEKSLELNNVDWKKVFMLPRLVTIESSLRSFQYKLLNNILYLNDRLFKFNIVDSPLCSLCKLENESVLHILCRCTITQKLWKQLQTWIPNLPNIEPEIVILGL